MTGGGSGSSRVEAIAAELADEIVAGRFPVGARYASELELRSRFDVGRHTIREALKRVTEQGLLGRRRKTGTFVLSTSPVAPYVHALRDLKTLLDFAEETRFDVSYTGFVSSRSKLFDGFNDLPDGRWLRLGGIRRVRDGGLPLCWTEILIPEQFSSPREELIASKRAVYETTLAHKGLRLEYVEQEVTGALLPAALLPLLEAKGDQAALLVKRRYVAHTGETFEVSHNLYPAGRYRLKSIIRQRA